MANTNVKTNAAVQPPPGHADILADSAKAAQLAGIINTAKEGITTAVISHEDVAGTGIADTVSEAHAESVPVSAKHLQDTHQAITDHQAKMKIDAAATEAVNLNAARESLKAQTANLAKGVAGTAIGLTGGIAQGAASKSNAAGKEIGAAAMKGVGNVGAASIKASGKIGVQAADTIAVVTVAGLQGVSAGGKVFAKEMLKHILLTASAIGVAGLKSGETVAKVLSSPAVQKELRGAADAAMKAGFITVQDSMLVVEVIALGAKKGLTAAVSALSGGARRTRRGRHRRTRRNRRNRSRGRRTSRR